QRFKVPVYVSHNIPSGVHHDQDVAIEKALVKELQRFLTPAPTEIGARHPQA
ncbi:hypothetical protein H4R34_003037, partial [Dimargaris verticillata]